MAKVYLESTDTLFIVNNSNTVVYGSDGKQIVAVASDITNITVDQNIAKVEFLGATNDYKYAQIGNQMAVYNKDGALIAAIPLQGDSDGTQFQFSNGTTNAVLTNGVMTLGGGSVPSTPASVTMTDSAITQTTTAPSTPIPTPDSGGGSSTDGGGSFGGSSGGGATAETVFSWKVTGVNTISATSSQNVAVKVASSSPDTYYDATSLKAGQPTDLTVVQMEYLQTDNIWFRNDSSYIITQDKAKIILGTLDNDTLISQSTSDAMFGFRSADNFVLKNAAITDKFQCIADYNAKGGDTIIFFSGTDAPTAIAWTTAVDGWTITNGVATKISATIGDFLKDFTAAIAGNATSGEIISFYDSVVKETYVLGKGVDTDNNVSFYMPGDIGNPVISTVSDSTQPTVSVANIGFYENTKSLVISGSGMSTLLGSGENATTDIKSRLDWTKFNWDVDTNSSYTPDISFTVGDIESAYVTNSGTLTIKVSDTKFTSMLGAEAYGGYGEVLNINGIKYARGPLPTDTIIIDKGFFVDQVDNAQNYGYDTTLNPISFTPQYIQTIQASDAINDTFIAADGKSELALVYSGSDKNSYTVDCSDFDGYTISIQGKAEQTYTLTNVSDSVKNLVNITDGVNVKVESSKIINFTRIGTSNDELSSSYKSDDEYNYGVNFNTGAGNDKLISGAGNDTFVFDDTALLNQDDTMNGGDGTDTLYLKAISGATTIADSQFTNVANIEELKIDQDSSTNIMLGANASGAFDKGISIYVAGDGATSKNTLTLDAADYTKSITLRSYDGVNAIKGGSSDDIFSIGGKSVSTVTFAADKAANGMDTIYYWASYTSSTTKFNFKAFLGTESKDANSVDFDKAGLDLTGSHNIGAISNESGVLSLSADNIATTLAMGKIAIADNGKAVIFCEQKAAEPAFLVNSSQPALIYIMCKIQILQPTPKLGMCNL